MFKRTLRWLRQKFPYPFRVTVRYCGPNKDDHGETTRTANGVAIKVYRTTNESNDIHTLLHEWAHAFEVWSEWPTNEHSAIWSAVYGEIYRAWDAWQNKDG